MEHISAHISKKASEEKITERGELMDHFRKILNEDRVRDHLPPLSMPRMGKILQGIPTKDLYYLKSVCEQSKNFSKKFWWEINPKKHALQASQSLPPKKKVGQ